jgi:hypothetical protein
MEKTIETVAGELARTDGRKGYYSPCLRRNYTRLDMTRQIRKLFLNVAFVPESRWQDLRI